MPLCTIRRSFFFPFLTLITRSSFSQSRRRSRTSGGFRLAADSSATAFSRACVGFGPLTADRQAFSMAKPPIAAGVDQALDIHRKCFSQIALDLIVLIDDLADLHDLVFTEILHPDGAIDSGSLKDVSSGCSPDPEHIRETDIGPLLPG